jgi:hypothetical protein
VSDAPSDELIGDHVGSYRIEHLIGDGAVGRVYRAADGDGEPVWIKVARRHIARDAVFAKASIARCGSRVSDRIRTSSQWPESKPSWTTERGRGESTVCQ